MLKLSSAVLLLLNFTGWLWWSGQMNARQNAVEQPPATSEQAEPLFLVSELSKDRLIYKKQVQDTAVIESPAGLLDEIKEEIATPQALTDKAISSEPQTERVPEQKLTRDQTETLESAASVAEVDVMHSLEYPNSACMTLGPFVETAQADKAEHELRGLQLQAERISSEMLVDSRYWLLLSPATDQAEAVKVYKSLTKQGIESFVIGAGEYAGYLSMGLFASRDNAQKRLDGLEMLRGEAFIREVSTKKTEYWLKTQSASPQQTAKLVQFQHSNPSLRLFGCTELADIQ